MGFLTLNNLIWLYKAKNSALPDGYEKIKGIVFDAGFYYKITDFYLKGSDTVRMSFSVTKACNVFGCYTGSSATDNYCMYASVTSGGKYLRYNGEAYASYFANSALNKRYDVVITPTGSSGMPEGQNSEWTAKDFTATNELCIGTTSPSATSSKLDGNIWGRIIVDGRFNGIPCKRKSDNAIGYYDTYSKTFYAKTGSGTPGVVT